MRTPIKGRPFSSWSDEKLNQHIEMFQNFCFAYSGNETMAKRELVREILHDLSIEHTERLIESPDVDDKSCQKAKPPTSKQKKFKKITKKC